MHKQKTHPAFINQRFLRQYKYEAYASIINQLYNVCFVPRSFDDDYESEELQVPGEIGNKMEKLVISDLTA